MQKTIIQTNENNERSFILTKAWGFFHADKLGSHFSQKCLLVHLSSGEVERRVEALETNYCCST